MIIDHNKESQAELASRLAKAKQQVEEGARYMHYKQLTYRVLMVALREEDNEPCVIYQAEYGEHIIFIRPVTSWLEIVEVDTVKVPRFIRLEEN